MLLEYFSVGIMGERQDQQDWGDGTAVEAIVFSMSAIYSNLLVHDTIQKYMYIMPSSAHGLLRRCAAVAHGALEGKRGDPSF